MADCTCFVTPEHTWTRYGSAIEPGSQMEPSPECSVHFPRIKVRRSKHSMNHRPDGHFNWQVRDIDGQTLVFRTHPLAVAAADRLARTGLIDPIGLVGCFKVAVHA